MENHRKNEYSYMLLLAVIVPLVLVIILAASGMSPFDANSYNSYSIQARSWLSGRLDVDYCPWLEQAIFQGKYYISFPPLPSVIMLPFVLIFESFGLATPDNILCLVFAGISAVYAYKTARALGKRAKESFFWALFVTIGSNYVFVGMLGWVWFIAQNLAFMFSMMAVFYAVRPERKLGGLSLFFLACAVGCRPLNLAFFPVILILLYKDGGKAALLKRILASWRWFIPAGCVAFFLCALNYFRFGSIFEFGHNFLPEFLESESGQFNIAYIPYNLLRSIRLPEYSGGEFSFPHFDGFAFYVTMPICISCAVYAFRRKKADPVAVVGFICILINLLATCAHKTMGGWHFGCRYFVDALPFVYLLTLRLSKDRKINSLDSALFAIGVFVNVAGTIAFYNSWL